ncbi:replication endonuclease [Halomonas mongoliensis]|uniref:replication endonuclease n=1 Tax=Halomonas mongoliensis TaxID=321265 RepID=UPI00403AB3EC
MTRFAPSMHMTASRRREQAMGTPWCRDFRRRIFERFPLVANDLLRGVVKVDADFGGGNRGNAKANTWLRAMEQQLTLGPFNATWDDQALEDYALVKAERVAAELGRLGREADAAFAHTRRRYCWQAPRPPGIRLAALVYRPHTWPCRRDAELEALREALEKAHGHCLDIDPPDELERLSRSQRATLLKKLSAAPWWRRKLRTEATRRVDQFHRLVKRVHVRAGIYLSDMALDRWRSSQAASRAMLEATTAVNQFEHEITLAKLAESGQANPKHRFAELMLRIRDTEDFGRRAGHCGVFVSWTLPSAYHAVLEKTSAHNPKFNGATPREAHRMLGKLWARARAKLKRDGIECYGLRVVEPHHDGTPHWHLMLFVDADQLGALKAILRRYALSIDPEEVAGREHIRIEFSDIDPAKGSAAAYVAKYIGKAIAGAAHPDDVDLYGKPMDVASERIVAWASVHGIRQFQFMGTPSVTVWRELRRLRDKEADPYAAASFEDWVAATRPDPEALAILEDLRRAADAGDWFGYLDVMGGVGVPASERPARPWRLPRLDTQAPEIDPETGEQRDGIEKRGIYGEAVMTTFGVVVTSATGQAEFLTRFYRWEVKPGAAAQGQRSGAAAEPWTRGNNCTGPDIRPRTPPPEVAEQQQGRLDEWRGSAEYQANLADIEECIRLDRAALELLRAERASTVAEYFPPELDGFDEPAPGAEPPRQNPVTPESKRAWRFLVSSAFAEKRHAAGIDDDQAARLAWRFFEAPPTKQDRQAWTRLLVTESRGQLDAARALATAHALWEAPAPVEPFPHQQHA